MYNLSQNTLFTFKTDEILRELLHMFDTKKRINEQCNRIRSTKKQDYGEYHDTKQ